MSYPPGCEVLEGDIDLPRSSSLSPHNELQSFSPSSEVSAIEHLEEASWLAGRVFRIGYLCISSIAQLCGSSPYLFTHKLPSYRVTQLPNPHLTQAIPPLSVPLSTQKIFPSLIITITITIHLAS